MGPRPRMGGGPGRRGPAHQRARRDSRDEAQLPRVLPAPASARARGRLLRMEAPRPGVGPVRLPREVPGALRHRGAVGRVASARGPPLRTFALLTTDASADVAPVHDRMPVILEAGAEALWLDAGLEDAARLHELLRPLPAGALESFVVSPRLNSSRMDDPSVQEPSAPPVPKPPSSARPAGRPQRSLFEDEDGDDAA